MFSGPAWWLLKIRCEEINSKPRHTLNLMNHFAVLVQQEIQKILYDKDCCQFFYCLVLQIILFHCALWQKLTNVAMVSVKLKRYFTTSKSADYFKWLLESQSFLLKSLSKKAQETWYLVAEVELISYKRKSCVIGENLLTCLVFWEGNLIDLLIKLFFLALESFFLASPSLSCYHCVEQIEPTWWIKDRKSYLHLYHPVQTMNISCHDYPNSHLSVPAFTSAFCLFILLIKETEELPKSQIRLSFWSPYSLPHIKIIHSFPWYLK